jgi:hypothetical protein
MSLRPLSLACLVPIAACSLGQDRPDQGTWSGIAFGDVYHVSGHHDDKAKGMGGLWVRRLNLTYDRKLDERVSARVRFEARSAGDFESDDLLDPFIKDLWVTVKMGAHDLQFGLIPTPAIEAYDSSLGFRHIERSPLDLYRMGDSRDKGVSMRGPIGDSKATYVVMVGNASGTKSENNRGKAAYGLVAVPVTQSLTLTGYADHQDKGDGNRWTTLAADAIYAPGKFRVGLGWGRQRRTAPAGDSTLGYWSIFADAKLVDGVRPFVRLDWPSDAVPDGDKVSYLKLAKTARPMVTMIGAEFPVGEHLWVVPNVQFVTYADTGAGKPWNDTFLRLTFLVKF